jgi:hypothetical protein
MFYGRAEGLDRRRGARPRPHATRLSLCSTHKSLTLSCRLPFSLSGMSTMLGMSTVRASMALTQIADAPPIRKAQFDLPDLTTVRKKVRVLKPPSKVSCRHHVVKGVFNGLSCAYRHSRRLGARGTRPTLPSPSSHSPQVRLDVILSIYIYTYIYIYIYI